MAELPDAKKWFSGFADITRWIKDHGTLVRLIIIVTIWYLLVHSVISIFSPKALPQKQDIQARDNASVTINNNPPAKNNEAGVFGGGLKVGDQVGGFGGLEYKRRF